MSFFSPRSTTRYLPLFEHATPYVVLNSDGSAFAMLEVDGLPMETAEDVDLFRAREQLNHTLCGMAGSDFLMLYSWVCRGFAPASIYPAGEFRSSYGRGFDERYRTHMLDRFLFMNRTYIGVMLRSPRFGGDWIGEKVIKVSRPRDVTDEKPEARIDRLLNIVAMLQRSLERYRPKRLGLRRDKAGRKFSQIAEGLAFAATGVWRSVGLQANNRIGSLFSERFIVGPETIEIRGPGQSAWAICFGAKHRPEVCPPGTFDGLLAAPFRSTISQSFRLADRQTALDFMGNKQHRMISAGDRAHSQIASLDLAMDEVQSGRMAMGQHGMVVTAFAETIENVPHVATDGWHLLQDAGLQVAREDLALESAFFSIFPGNERLQPRPGMISTWNYASMTSMHAYPKGPERGRWGGAIMLLRTVGGTPFLFHVQNNIFAFGESGSGKTVFLGTLIAQSERLNAQCIVFDKDRGLEIGIRMMGGRYLPILLPTGIAALKALTNSTADIHHLAALIRGQIAMADDYKMSPEESRRLFIGLHAIMALPPQDRWYIDLCAFLGANIGGARARLERWCWGNEYGGVTDCPEDFVDLNARVLGFDVTEFVDDPMICGPVMFNLLYRTGKLADGRRGMTIVDEGWKVVNIPAFADAAANEMKTDRKLNWTFVFGTQSIRDARNSAIAHTIREQCKTVLAFGVERPDRDDFKWLRYNDRESEIIEGLTPDTFLLRQGKISTILQLALSDQPDDLAVLSGTALNVKVLDGVRARLGDDATPEALLAEFHRVREREHL